MNKIFDGKKIRDEILEELRTEVSKHDKKPKLAVIWAGDNFASDKYINAKRTAAEKCGIIFEVHRFDDSVTEEMILTEVKELNQDENVTGILVQLPMPAGIDQRKIIDSVAEIKDVDGLRFCYDIPCTFRAPVTLAIIRAIHESGQNIQQSKIAIVGQGFLVGAPITKILQPMAREVRVADIKTPYLGTITSDVDILISATGRGRIIKPEMIKKDVVLVDAGTTEMNGELAGDVDPLCYEKASYYTPVPGGIGPVTVAMLLSNVVESFKLQNK